MGRGQDRRRQATPTTCSVTTARERGCNSRRSSKNGIRAIALGSGALWIALDRRPRILRLTPGAAAAHGGWLTHPADALTYGAGHVWASIPEDDAVARLDPRSGRVRTRAAARRPAQLAVAHRQVFVASNTTDTVVVLDPRTIKRAGTPLPVPPNPVGVAAGAGHVWVTGLGTNTLTRIDH
jgi:DNA-binding beta-propeller fold protein YncE